jgi:hypothetical protein
VRAFGVESDGLKVVAVERHRHDGSWFLAAGAALGMLPVPAVRIMQLF